MLNPAERSRSPEGLTVLVTGGAGFIGSNLVRRLLTTDGVAEVRVLDDRSNGEHGHLDGLPVVDHHASILDADALDAAADGADVIVHLAALASVPESIADPVAYHRVNVTGTVKVLEAARRHGNLHTIVASSAAVYGRSTSSSLNRVADNQDPGQAAADQAPGDSTESDSAAHHSQHEGLAPEPLSPYASTKLATESYALAYGASYDLPVLAFRFFNIYGPLQPPDHVYAAVVPAFVDAALAGRPLQIHGDGRQTRDFTFVDSVTAVLAAAITRKVTHPGPVNLASGTTASLLELIAAIESILGHPVHTERQPTRPGDIRHSAADVTVLKRLFPELKPVVLRDGVHATVEWFQDRSDE